MKLREATEMFVMVDYVREVTVKKTCKYGEYRLLEHLLLLLFVRLLLSEKQGFSAAIPYPKRKAFSHRSYVCSTAWTFSRNSYTVHVHTMQTCTQSVRYLVLYGTCEYLITQMLRFCCK